MNIVIFLLSFFSLLILSGFFSGSETALFSLNMVKKKKLARKQSGKLILQLLERPRKLLITILVGNTLVNVALASISDLYFETQFGKSGLFLSIVVSTLVLLFFGEITPKIIALNLQEYFALGATRILSIFFHFLSPVVFLLNKFSSLVLSFWSEAADEQEVNITRKEIKSLFNVGKVVTSFHRREKEIIDNLMEFGEATLSAIKIPRTNMVSISEDRPIEEIVHIIRESGFSRIPVYRDNPDNIIGVLYAKDLIPVMMGISATKDIRLLYRRPIFIPEQKKAAILFQEMVKSKQHLVITIDEFGAISGLVSLEDLIEEIVGEIYDEWDPTPKKIEPLDDDTIRIPAELDLHKFNKEFHKQFHDGSSSTIGGYVLQKIGRLPEEGDEIDIEDLLFTIETTSKTKISSLILRRIPIENREDQ